MTGFVIEEQGDWFEPELPFLRSLIEPGWSCMDVGSAYGCYALAMATASGAAGRVLAIEPHPKTVDFLRSGIKASKLGQRTRVEAAALSSQSGKARLTDPMDPELACLAEDGVTKVDTTTLDELVGTGPGPHLIKIDTEGRGAEVLAGATRTLAQGEAIIQFVLSHSGSPQVRACHGLMRSGYLIYRLVPGLGVLAPLVPGESLDSYAINAFAVKPEVVGRLAARGRLVGVVDDTTQLPEGLKVHDVIARTAASPWIAPFHPQWAPNAILAGWENQRRAVALAVTAMDRALPAEQRCACLVRAMIDARRSVAAGINGSRLATLARVALDLGMRTEAVHALDRLARSLGGADDAALAATFREPFLLPMPTHEAMPFPDQAGQLRCAILESLAFAGGFSAYFGGASHQSLYERIASLPVHSPRTDRALALIRRRSSNRRSPILVLNR